MTGGARLRVLLLGGFEVWHDKEPLRFESQKVRALFAYLLLNRGRSFSRDRLAALLWPERDEDTARRNLRQAIYNLKASLPESAAAPFVVADHDAVKFSPDALAWLDVDGFRDALRKGGPGERGAASHDLVTAVNLYRGELLAGFYLKDSVEFEEWLAGEQERLREQAIGALRVLVEIYRSRGELRLGVQYARRLVAMDPLSEESHRDLMRLYALSGQRNRALAHFRDVRDLLSRELGVDPLEETAELYEGILREEVLEAAAADRGAPPRPIVPLVGRAAAYEALRECWATVLEGRPRVTLVEGEAGVGKTRLIRSFLDGATARRRGVVLTGRCFDRFPDLPFRPFVEMLRQAYLREGEDGFSPAGALPARALRSLTRLLPELARAGAHAGDRPPAVDERKRQFAAVAEAFTRAGAGGEGSGEPFPVVLFIDDLQWADPATLALLEDLAERLGGAPVWLLAACRSDALTGAPALRRLAERAAPGGPVSRVRLERLDAGDVEEIAHALVSEAQVGELADALAASGGLPIAVVALVNTLWDDGALVYESAGAQRWTLVPVAPAPGRYLPAELKQLISARVRRLPASTRRIASLAAVAGHDFDAELLCHAEDEHMTVVEVGLELLLERWLVRQSPPRWNPSGLESGLGPWSRGVRGGRFEFDHEIVRRTVYDDISPLRKPVLHAQVARALAALRAPGTDGREEDLAFHTLQAGDWAAAADHLAGAARVALARLAPENALLCLERALALAERQVAQAPGEEEATRWRVLAGRLSAAAARAAKASQKS